MYFHCGQQLNCALIQKIVGPTGPYGQFGYFSDAYDDVIAIASPGYPNGISVGIVHLYYNVNDTYVLYKVIDSPMNSSGFYFGSYLRMYRSSRLVVSSQNYNNYTGKVYVYERNTPFADAWGLVVELTGPFPNSYYGFWFDISSDLLVVGAPGYAAGLTDIGFLSSPVISTVPPLGQAFVYSYVNQTASYWKTLYGENVLDFFGYSVAINDAGLVAVGSPNSKNGTGHGAVYLYDRSDGFSTFSVIYGNFTKNCFGSGISLSSTAIVMGSPSYPGGLQEDGACVIYEMDENGIFRYVTAFTGFNGGALGLINKIAGSQGQYIFSGEPAYDSMSGRVRLYSESCGNWSFIGTISSPDTGARFGIGVNPVVSRNLVAIAGDFYGNSTGALYVLSCDPSFFNDSAPSCPSPLASFPLSSFALVLFSAIFFPLFCCCLFFFLCCCCSLCVVFVFFVPVLCAIPIIVALLLISLSGVVSSSALLISKRLKKTRGIDLAPTLCGSEEDMQCLRGMKQYREIPFAELELGKILGRGSMSTAVYSGKWRKLPVAIKIIPVDPCNHCFLDDLKRELEVYCHLGAHPNVLPMIGACTTRPNLIYLVFQLCPGGSLYQLLLMKDSKISADQFCVLLLDSAVGLAYLHAENVVHRDVASRNYLVGDPFRIYISDFGMSRLLLRTEVQSTQSDLGPVRWLPPESLMDNLYSRKTDVYMYAMFLYEVLYRQIPYFEVWNLLDVAELIRNGTRPTLLHSSFHPCFLEIFERCWSANPSDRYTMQEILIKFKASFSILSSETGLINNCILSTGDSFESPAQYLKLGG